MTETKSLPNQKLRYERERRGWSQQDVADKVGTTPLNVGRWERGVTLPGPHFLQKLSEVFKKNMQELGLAATDGETAKQVPLSPPVISPAQETALSVWNVPYKRNLLFTGREDVLSRLHDAFLNQQQPIALAQPQAISGLGGIGKTQTAVEYVYRYQEH
jgi:transcriptional regulator with XRE-family HTH domain